MLKKKEKSIFVGDFSMMIPSQIEPYSLIIRDYVYDLLSWSFILIFIFRSIHPFCHVQGEGYKQLHRESTRYNRQVDRLEERSIDREATTIEHVLKTTYMHIHTYKHAFSFRHKPRFNLALLFSLSNSGCLYTNTSIFIIDILLHCFDERISNVNPLTLDFVLSHSQVANLSAT